MSRSQDLENYRRYRDSVMSGAERVESFLEEVEGELSQQADESHSDPVTSLRAAVRQSRKGLEDGTFQVAFVGQMKAGKSTLVNASIFRDQVLPVASTPQTAKLTIVEQLRESGASSATVHFYSEDKWREIEKKAAEEQEVSEGEFSHTRQLQQAYDRIGRSRVRSLLGKTRQIKLAELDKYVASYDEFEDQGQFVDITESVRIQYPFNWGDGVEVVDTPGTNDPNELREQVTLDYLRQADAVILVLYGGRPGDREDITFLKKQLLPVGLSQVIVAVNKWDQVPEDQQGDVKEYLRKLLVEQVEQAEDVEFPDEFRRLLDTDEMYAVSGLRALLGRTQADIQDGKFYWRKTCRQKGVDSYEEALDTSGVPELEAGIQEYLYENKGRELLLSPLRKSEGSLNKVQSTLDEQMGRIAKRIDNLLKNLEELKKARENKEAQVERVNSGLDKVEAELRRLVKRELGDISRKGKSTIDRFVSKARRAARSRINGLSRWEASTSREHIGDLNADLGWDARELARKLEDLITRKLEDVERTLRGDLRDIVREHLSEYHKSPWIQEKIDAIGRVEFDRSDISAPTVSVDDGFISGVKTFVRVSNYKDKLKSKIESEINKYESNCENYLKSIPDSLTERVLQHVEEILNDIRRHYEDELEDIEAEIEAKQDEQREIDTEKRKMEEQKECLQELHSRAGSLKETISATKTEIE